MLVEKDEEMRDLIATLLIAQYGNDISIIQSSCGTDALKQLDQKEFDLLMMDWTLPELSGNEFLKKVRQKFNFENLDILVLTKETTPEEHLMLVESGATDYLVKPFDRTALLMRVKALLRRNQEFEPGKIILGKITLDTKSFDVYCGSERVHLTPSEFKLLHALADRRGTVLTREALIELVQGQGIAVIDRAVDTHIFGLRKKLGNEADTIETVRGVGYRVKA